MKSAMKTIFMLLLAAWPVATQVAESGRIEDVGAMAGHATTQAQAADTTCLRLDGRNAGSAMNPFPFNKLSITGNPTMFAPNLLLSATSQLPGNYDFVMRPKAEDGVTSMVFARSPLTGKSPSEGIASIEAHGNFTDDKKTNFTDRNLIFYTAGAAGDLQPIARFEALQMLPRILLGRGSDIEPTGEIQVHSLFGIRMRARGPLKILKIERASGVVQVTLAAPASKASPFAVGDVVQIAGVKDSSFDGYFSITSTIGLTQFSYAQAGEDASSSGGTESDNQSQQFVFPARGGIYARNSANTTDLNVLTTNGGFGMDNIAIGSSAGIDSIFLDPRATGTPILRARTGGVRIGDGGLPTATLDVAGTVKIGGGSEIKKYARYSATITPGSVGANSCAEQSFTLAGFSGLEASDVIILNFAIADTTPTIVKGSRAINNGIAVTYCNFTPGRVTPGAGTVHVVAWR